MSVDVLHFGGNGHAAMRLEAARASLARRAGAPRLVDVPYPGFEGRSRAASIDEFFDVVEAFLRDREQPATAAVASGIGALIALALRARGTLSHPLILQAPVLWGLGHRTFPKLMRWRAARWLFSRSFHLAPVRKRLARGLFLRPVSAAFRDRFFDGYVRCAAFADLFCWFTPEWLRRLERQLAERPGALDRITVWVGGRDPVVGRKELEWTEQAIHVQWPVVVFPDWGHYPMIDVPQEWADALCDAVAAP
jgi:pimeloyl-ACP methyl ester carboxylesterase